MPEKGTLWAFLKTLPRGISCMTLKRGLFEQCIQQRLMKALLEGDFDSQCMIEPENFIVVILERPMLCMMSCYSLMATTHFCMIS